MRHLARILRLRQAAADEDLRTLWRSVAKLFTRILDCTDTQSAAAKLSSHITPVPRVRGTQTLH